MKKVILSLFAVVAMSFASAPAQACGSSCGCDKSKGNTTAKNKAPKNASMVVIAVKGMSCGGCAAKIASELKGIKGVYAATVEFKTKRATVKYAAKKVAVAKLLKTIRELGYKVNIVKRS